MSLISSLVASATTIVNFLKFMTGVEDLEDGVENELVEGSLQWLATSWSSSCPLLRPLLGLGIEVVVAPQTLHHLVLVDTELLGISLSELSDSESPAV